MKKLRLNWTVYSLLLTQLATMAFAPLRAQGIFKSKVVDVDSELNFNDPWYDKKKSDEENFKRLVQGLSKVPTGKKVIERATEKASEHGQTLFDVIALGDGSLTDTTLIRRFQASNPANVVYETRSKVYLSKHLRTLDALLDFAHELTHYTYREPFNPYDARFKLKDFIKSTVEGRGGEVDAFMVECKVLKELVPGEGFYRSNCQRVFDQRTGHVSKDLGIVEFYKVGNHYDDLKKDYGKYSKLEQDLPHTSNSDALFISSAWGLPYPVAAVREYVNIMDRVCKNDKNRLSLMEQKVGRSPASAMSDDGRTYQNMFEDYKARCEKFSTM
jgi:hypothetical protein